MAVTRAMRKLKKRRRVTFKKQQAVKLLSAKPVIKNIDVEAIKAEFAAKA